MKKLFIFLFLIILNLKAEESFSIKFLDCETQTELISEDILLNSNSYSNADMNLNAQEYYFSIETKLLTHQNQEIELRRKKVVDNQIVYLLTDGQEVIFYLKENNQTFPKLIDQDYFVDCKNLHNSWNLVSSGIEQNISSFFEDNQHLTSNGYDGVRIFSFDETWSIFNNNQYSSNDYLNSNLGYWFKTNTSQGTGIRFYGVKDFYNKFLSSEDLSDFSINYPPILSKNGAISSQIDNCGYQTVSLEFENLNSDEVTYEWSSNDANITNLNSSEVKIIDFNNLDEVTLKLKATNKNFPNSWIKTEINISRNSSLNEYQLSDEDKYFCENQ